MFFKGARCDTSLLPHADLETGDETARNCPKQSIEPNLTTQYFWRENGRFQIKIDTFQFYFRGHF